MYIAENPEDEVFSRANKYPRFWQAYFMEHWPTPQLIPRRDERGVFENVVYVGSPLELDKSFRGEDFKEKLRVLGLNFMIIDSPGRWNDFSEADCVLSVRNFNDKKHLRKPASKLINAWLAGVPAVLGPEAAFRAKRRSSLDYIEVTNYRETLEALKKLKEDPSLRAKMIENGLERGKEYTAEKTAQRWEHFINNVVIPEYETWLKLPQRRVKDFFDRRERYYKTKDITVFDPLPIRVLKKILKK